MLLAFTCERAMGNLWSICLWVNILRLESPEKLVSLAFIGNVLLSKALRSLSLHLKRL